MHNTKLSGLNVQAPWARLLLDGKKTIETRTYPLPAKYRDQDLWLIETPGKLGKFKARVVGVIRFLSCKQYMSANMFNDDVGLHLIQSSDLSYGWRDGVEKFGWTVALVRPVDPFDAPYPRGIIYAGPFGIEVENTL